jgi:hypothetical protein
MKTNDIKKGMRIQLKNGWFGTMMDNRKGNIRYAEIEGFFTEIGSVYSADIARVKVDDEWIEVEHTEKQKQASDMFNSLF